MELWGHIDRLAALGRDESDAQRWRGRFIATICVLGAAGSLVLGLLYLLSADWLDAAVTPLGAVFCSLLLVAWRKTKRAAWIANAFGVFSTLTYALGFLVHRELSMVAWLAVVPLLVLFLGGRKLGLAWFAVELALVAGGVALTLVDPKPIAAELLTSNAPLVRLLTLMIVVFALGFVFDFSAASVIERLRVASETKTRFLANVSHELRTPLNGVLGMAELMSQHELSNSQRERLSTIIQSGQQLRMLIDDVLDATQLERGQLKVSDGPVSAAEVAATVVKQLQSMADARRLSLALETPGEALALRTDALRLMQILSNFTHNALKFTERGGVTVVVQTTREKDEQVRLVIEVRDTGPGIEAVDLTRLFQPFSRLNAHTPGTGLGLSITRTIAALLGGDVSARSKVGEGSVFRFEMVRPRAMLSLEIPAAVAPAGSDARRTRVLLVDDNPINLKVARGLLEKLGCEVVSAVDGAKAVEAFKPGAFDLVLMDLHMPVMDGFESARRIRELDASVAIFALSATTVQEELDRVPTVGMNGFLAKPVRVDALKEAIPAPGNPRMSA